MTIRTLLAATAVTALATSLAIGAAVAAQPANDEATDAQALRAAKVSLAQAIATVEQQTGGRAINAGVDDQNGTMRIGVEVATGQGVKTVLVDMQSGQITGTKSGDKDGEGND